MKILNTILIVFLSAFLASANEIKYEHSLEFIKYEVDEVKKNEEDLLTVKIYTIGAMESKFNKVKEEFTQKQQELFEDHKNNSEKSLKQFNENLQNIDENLMEINKLIKEDFGKYESFKTEMSAKKENLTEKYMQNILSHQNALNLKEQLCKSGIDHLNKEMKNLTNLLDGSTRCSPERKENIKREIQAAHKNLKKENNDCKESVQFYRDQITNLKSNITDDLIKLLTTENQEFTKLIENFYIILNSEILSNSSSLLKMQYFKERELIDLSFQSSLQNLNEMLSFNSIKPKREEAIFKTNENEMESEGFLRDFLTKTNGMECNRQLPIIWEKIHEKTTFIPESPVIAGYDVDGAKLYVVRACNGTECTYGKYARSAARKNAYIPYENAEKGEKAIELLTTLSYEWCEYDKNLNYDNLPVCRVEYNNTTIPGTLQNDGKCRIGYGWKIIILEKNIEVLGIGGC